MHKKFIVKPRARRDIREILGYIGADNLVAAERMRERFYEAFAKLSEYPEMGQQREELTRKPVRFWPAHPNYMIIYNPDSDPIQILRITHTARLTEALMH
jgi:plasmid stabilization system protein ParE